MRFINIVLTASLILLLYILSVAPSQAAEDILGPNKIALSPDGNIYALSSNYANTSDYIFVFSPDGTPVRTLDRHVGNLAFDDAGNLYVVDMTPYKSGQPAIFNITKLDKNRNSTLLWSNVNQSDLVVADMAVSPDGVVYFSTVYPIQNRSAQTGNSALNCWEIDAIDARGTLRTVRTINTTPASSDDLYILAVDRNGTVYTAGVSNRITVISPDGTTGTIGKLGSENGTFNWISDIAIGRDGYLYVAELGNQRVQKLTTDGTFVAKWNGCGPDPFIKHFELEIDENGRVYVADLDNRRIVWFTPGYTYGIDESENLKGQGITWGNVYAGTNYTIQLIERKFDELQNGNGAGNEATPTPGLSPFISLVAISLAGIILCLRRAGTKR